MDPSSCECEPAGASAVPRAPSSSSSFSSSSSISSTSFFTTSSSTPGSPLDRDPIAASTSLLSPSAHPSKQLKPESSSTSIAAADTSRPGMARRFYGIARSSSSFCSVASHLSSASSSSSTSTSSSMSAVSSTPTASTPFLSDQHRKPSLLEGLHCFSLSSFLRWLKEHPSSSKVGSENMARFLLVKSVSLIAACLGFFYSLVFDHSAAISACSLALFTIPAIQSYTGSSRACGLFLSFVLAMLIFSFQSRPLPLLGPSLESTLLYGLPLVSGMLVGRKVGLLTAFAVIGYTVDEYRSRTKVVMTRDEAARLWAGYGAYWVSLFFFSTLTCLYQWCVEVCVKDANLFKDIAVANAKSKDGVVSSVSHELRTPLAALIGWTELLLSDHSLSASARSTVSMLHSSTLSLLTILNALLDVSKVSAAKMTTCNQNFNLHDLVLDTARMMTGLSGTRSVELLVDFSAEVPELVRADSGLIKQVLGNLVSNAIKFTDAGYVNVGVSLKDEDDDTVTVQFVVQDTGRGIADEQKDKLFMEYYQVEGGKCKSHEAGTGLGLFLVKNLVELMDGTVFVSSEAGVGSTFGFVIKMEKQYLAFRTPGYDHVVTVSSAFQAGLAPPLDPASPMLPVTPGLARSTTPMPVANDGMRYGTTTTTTIGGERLTDSDQPKDYFNLQPSEETRANANNITLRTRDNAFLSNRQYYVHSQCDYFENFLWQTAAGTWKAVDARRLSYDECVRGYKPEPIPEKPLAYFGDVYLIDLSPTTNRPKSTIELSDQEHVQQFLTKLARHLIKHATARVSKVRQASLILFYPFGHPPSLAQEPFVELATYYQISLCRKPVSERALGSIVKRQIVTIQKADVISPPSPIYSFPGAGHFLNAQVSIPQRPTLEKVANTTAYRSDSSTSGSTLSSDFGRQNSIESMTSQSSTLGNGTSVQESKIVEEEVVMSKTESPMSIGSAFTSDQSMGTSMDDFKLTLPQEGLRIGSRKKSQNMKLGRNNSAPSKERTSPILSPPQQHQQQSTGTSSPTTTASHVRFAKRNGSSGSVTTTTTTTTSNQRVLSMDPNMSCTSPAAQEPRRGKGLLKHYVSISSQKSIQDLNATGKRVLIVDDNSCNRLLLLQQLAKLGVSKVDQAESGQEAIERFVPGVHCLILMDLNMPTMNGLQATHLIREKEKQSLNTDGSVCTPLGNGVKDHRGFSKSEHMNGSVAYMENGHRDEKTRRTTTTTMPGAFRDRLSRHETKAASDYGATIIAVTADGAADTGEDREKVIKEGFDDVMVKPISLPSLSLLLERQAGQCV